MCDWEGSPALCSVLGTLVSEGRQCPRTHRQDSSEHAASPGWPSHKENEKGFVNQDSRRLRGAA